jgi:hypothetical protein
MGKEDAMESLRGGLSRLLLTVVMSLLTAAACGAEPDETVTGIVTDEHGRPLEGVTVKMCGVERFHDGRWHRNWRADCMVPRPSVSDKTGRFTVRLTEAAFDMPFDEKKTRLNFWFDKQGFAPTYLAGVSPQPDDLRVVMKRGIHVSGKVKMRLIGGQLEPIHGATVYLQCSSGDLAHQERVFDDPYFFLLAMGKAGAKEGCDLPYRQCAQTDADGRYTVVLSPPPEGKRWFLVCSDEGWNQRSRWQGPKAMHGVMLDVQEGQPVKGPDFEVAVKVHEPAQGDVHPDAADTAR